jgi:hypothetical protein
VNDYADSCIEVSEQGLTIRRYYFPLGSKHVPFEAIRSVRRVQIGPMTGQGRIWGTANPRYWANLDPARRRKNAGFIIDVGAVVRPFITPDDPNAFESALNRHISVEVQVGRSVII